MRSLKKENQDAEKTADQSVLPLVSVVRGAEGDDKLEHFKTLMEMTGFEGHLLTRWKESGKEKKNYKIIIKPNMMVYTNPKEHTAVVTDKDLVECLVDHILGLGFVDIKVCEAQNDVGRMLNNHNVDFISRQIGYDPRGRYQIVDLTMEQLPFTYTYKKPGGGTGKWKDRVGMSWMEADFRITFAKCKTHEHDWMTLGLKNVYGCLPRADKVAKYHIKSEVWDVTARSLCDFPLHFCFIDGWEASDGFQGYKMPHPKQLRMLFGGPDTVAVDMEVFKRAGVDPFKSHFIKRAVEQLYDDAKYPEYRVEGDKDTQFSQLCDWENISDKIVHDIDILEEVYISWGLINLKAISTEVDYKLFTPKNFFYRFLVWLSKKLYGFFKLFKWYRKLYSGNGDKKSKK